MGLRFRKSIKILPGVRLNIGKNSMSVSAGVPGFRKTFSTTGKVTTTVGIPGTGLYYVDTKNSNTSRNNQTRNRRMATSTQSSVTPNYEQTNYDIFDNDEMNVDLNSNYELVQENPNIIQLSEDAIRNIHKNSDDTIDWTEVLVSEEAPDDTYNQELWKYYHSISPKILSGDIESYLKLIYEINPLDDLLDYGSEFEFGTDDSKKVEVEFNINTNALSNFKESSTTQKYNDLLQDYVCSVCIRIARDMFALLPVSYTFVHATLENNTIVSIKFDRNKMNNIKFGFIDPSNTIEKFNHNMDFSSDFGFRIVDRLE